MKILINLSIIHSGGGLQVALSLIDELKKIEGNRYYFLVSENIFAQLSSDYPITFKFYLIDPSPSKIIKGYKSRRKLKQIESKIKPDIVFTLFGPAYHSFLAPHLCGFALAQHLYKESPYFLIIPFKEEALLKIRELGKMHSFKKHCDYWLTETVDVADRLSESLKVSRDKVFTVNNVYNGIFDEPEKWKENELKKEGNQFRLITISSFHTHKNLLIIPAVIDYLKDNYPDLEFAFVLTIDADKFPDLTENQKKHIHFLGRVDIEECPSLYEQSDALFMPTLLECFTVSYLEAMKMQKVILTSDLPFAHDICQDAAEYFQPLDPKDVGEKIVKVAINKARQQELIEKGTDRLQEFGTAEDRARKYLEIMEKIVAEN